MPKGRPRALPPRHAAHVAPAPRLVVADVQRDPVEASLAHLVKAPGGSARIVQEGAPVRGEIGRLGRSGKRRARAADAADFVQRCRAEPLRWAGDRGSVLRNGRAGRSRSRSCGEHKRGHAEEKDATPCAACGVGARGSHAPTFRSAANRPPTAVSPSANSPGRAQAPGAARPWRLAAKPVTPSRRLTRTRWSSKGAAGEARPSTVVVAARNPASRTAPITPRSYLPPG